MNDANLARYLSFVTTHPTRNRVPVCTRLVVSQM